MELQAVNLHRNFGSVKALDGVSFRLNPGEVTGLIGPNGAGKSTLLNIIAGRDLPDAGSVLCNGIDLCDHPEKCLSLIGFMPDTLLESVNTSVEEHLDFSLRIRGVCNTERKKRIAEVMDLTGIRDQSDRLLAELSKGMRQRVSLARLLLQRADLFLLDEPAEGLDPQARSELKDILRDLAKQGKSIFVSSHILSEMETLCDSTVILNKGRLSMPEDLLPQNAKVLLLTLSGPAESFADTLAHRDGVLSCRGETRTRLRLELAEGADPAKFAASLIEEGIPVAGFELAERKLESLYRNVAEKGGTL